MSVQKFQHKSDKSDSFEAIQRLGTVENYRAICAFVGNPDMVGTDDIEPGEYERSIPLIVETPAGPEEAWHLDWITKNHAGECAVVDRKVFEKVYIPVNQ
jgi:hypothetical protein